MGSVSSAKSDRLTDLTRALQELTQKVAPAVVHIRVSGYQPALGDITDAGLLPRRQGSGSGVIVDTRGYVITNYHVIEGASRIQVYLSMRQDSDRQWRSILKPGVKPLLARLVGVDIETDLAVLKIPARELPFIEIGDSDSLRQGQLVLALGSPFGLENSVTLGIISAVARQLVIDDPMIYVQTDAPINPGNSGGALVNMNGALIGINTLIVSKSGGSEGVGFAAPSNIVRHVYDQIRKYGHVRRGAIGVKAQTITPTMARGLDLPRDWGIVLGDVYPDLPAYDAGLKIGDIVLSLNGKPMENGRQFDVNLYRLNVGDSVAVEIMRGSSIDTIMVEVMQRPGDPGRFADLVTPDDNLIPSLGILAIELSQQVIAQLPPLRRTSGVLVAARERGGIPISTGFRPGDVIYEINRIPVGGLSGLRLLMRRLGTGDAIVAHVERQGRLMYLAFELP